VIAAISTAFPFVGWGTSFYAILRSNLVVYIVQFVGQLIASTLYLSRLLKPMLDERKERKMDALKERQAQLEDEHRKLQKEHKKLKKQVSQKEE
jgi:uncharacterized protein YlxW (UPF0749 family)